MNNDILMIIIMFLTLILIYLVYLINLNKEISIKSHKIINKYPEISEKIIQYQKQNLEDNFNKKINFDLQEDLRMIYKIPH